MKAYIRTEKIRKGAIRSIAIIGGGPSGLTALKTFLREPKNCVYEKIVLFERSHSIGGVWDITNRDSPMYETLHTNTSRRMMSYTDFPMNYRADYPSYKEVYEYLLDYANHFKLHDNILLNTEVVNVKKNEDQKWTICYKDIGGTVLSDIFDAVIVANGHYSVPKIPPELMLLKETYKAGKVIHSKDYKTNDIFEGKTVLIVGVASSGAEICAKIAVCAKKTYLACRENATISQKYLWGKPTDQLTRRRFLLHIPTLLYQIIQYFFFSLHSPWGLPFRQVNRNISKNITPGVSTECLQYIGDGIIEVTMPIESFDENNIVLPIYSEKDKIGKISISPDYIVLCTGYELSFPFLEKNIIQVDYRVMPLFKQVFNINDPTICFLGLPIRVEPLPSSELQARWIDGVWSGEIGLPTKKEMNLDNTRREMAMKKKNILLRFWHTVDYLPYMDEIAKLGGFYADSFKWQNSKLFIALMFWPAVPFQYRIDGRGKTKQAREQLISIWNN